MSAMDRVTSLKRYHSSPALLLKGFSGLCRIEAITRKRRIPRPIQQAYRPAEQPLALFVERAHSRMRSVSSQINTFGFALLVITKLLPEVEHSQKMIVTRVEPDIGFVLQANGE